jgi:hypothetical protein
MVWREEKDSKYKSHCSTEVHGFDRPPRHNVSFVYEGHIAKELQLMRFGFSTLLVHGLQRVRAVACVTPGRKSHIAPARSDVGLALPGFCDPWGGSTTVHYLYRLFSASIIVGEGGGMVG